MGRPSSYSKVLGDRIADLMADGIALHRICAREGMPTDRTLRNWLATPDHPFFPQYVRARERQADRFAEEIVSLADECPADRDAVAKVKAQQWARAWAAGRMAPKKYGDRVAVDQHVTGQVAHEHKVEHALAADADTLAEVLGILAPLRGNGHDKSADGDSEPTLQ